MDRRAAWVLGIIFGGMFLCLFAALALLFLFRSEDSSKSYATGDRVGIVEVLGPITDSKKVLKELKEFKETAGIKAVVVRVDSPGGSVGPSQEIYDAIRKLREKKKVVASMGALAASGGFYIASAAEKVFANPGTLTGSIGVIFQIPNVSGLMKWAGVQINTITAGKMKDSGSPFRDMTTEEKAYFHGVLSDVHTQFIEAVAEGRGLKVEQVAPYADGRVFTGRQAKEWNFVDELGGLNEAVAAAAKMAGIKGEPKVEYPRREKKFLRDLLSDEPESLVRDAIRTAIDQLGGSGLQYRFSLTNVP